MASSPLTCMKISCMCHLSLLAKQELRTCTHAHHHTPHHTTPSRAKREQQELSIRAGAAMQRLHAHHHTLHHTTPHRILLTCNTGAAGAEIPCRGGDAAHGHLRLWSQPPQLKPTEKYGGLQEEGSSGYVCCNECQVKKSLFAQVLYLNLESHTALRFLLKFWRYNPHLPWSPCP